MFQNSFPPKFINLLPSFTDDFMYNANILDDIISDMEFNSDGTELWLSCKDSHITVIETNQWHVVKNVSPDSFYIKTLIRLSASMAQDIFRRTLKNLYIGAANTDKLVFLTEDDVRGTIDLKPFIPWKCSSVKRLSCSPDNKILTVILRDGTLKLYSMEFLLRQVFQRLTPQRTPLEQTCSEMTQNLNGFDKQVSEESLLMSLQTKE